MIHSSRVPLAYRAPLATSALFAFLGARAIPGVESFDGSTFRRTLPVAGSPAVVSLEPRSDDSIELTVEGSHRPTVEEIADLVRSVLDLDADPREIDPKLSSDPLLRERVRANPGIRVPGAFDGSELAVRAVLGQQVSVAGARTLAGRLAARFGTPVETEDPALTHLFPDAERLADADLSGLGLPAGRARTICAVSNAVVTGSLDLSDRGEGRSIDALLEVPGVGPWTAAYRDAGPPGPRRVPGERPGPHEGVPGGRPPGLPGRRRGSLAGMATVPGLRGHVSVGRLSGIRSNAAAGGRAGCR